MAQLMQVTELHSEFDRLQQIYGARNLHSIYGAGQTNSPRVMFVFMNPTGRNISADPNWKGLRAPWLGTKQVWKLLREVGLISIQFFEHTQQLRPHEWTPNFSEEIYKSIADNGAYLTNLAKCTQIDARPLPNSMFARYRESLVKEIGLINPAHVILFGNQVSSIVLERSISVGNYSGTQHESLEHMRGDRVRLYPTFYPVGQGQRNMPLAVQRIQSILR